MIPCNWGHRMATPRSTLSMVGILCMQILCKDLSNPNYIFAYIKSYANLQKSKPIAVSVVPLALLFAQCLAQEELAQHINDNW